MTSEGVQPQRELCDEIVRLLEQYATKANEFRRTVNLLNNTVIELSEDEYNDTRAFMEKDHSQCEAARLALDRHTADHGC